MKGMKAKMHYGQLQKPEGLLEIEGLHVPYIYATATREICRTCEKCAARGHSEFISGTKPLEDPNRIPVWVARAT